MRTYLSAIVKRLVLPLDEVIGCAAMYELGEFDYEKSKLYLFVFAVV